MSIKLQVTFPSNPIIADLGPDHSTIIYCGQVINKRSALALGCEIQESTGRKYQWGDKINLYDFAGEFDRKATFIGADDHDRRFAIVQHNDGGIDSVLFTQIKPNAED